MSSAAVVIYPLKKMKNKLDYSKVSAQLFKTNDVVS